MPVTAKVTAEVRVDIMTRHARLAQAPWDRRRLPHPERLLVTLQMRGLQAQYRQRSDRGLG